MLRCTDLHAALVIVLSPDARGYFFLVAGVVGTLLAVGFVVLIVRILRKHPDLSDALRKLGEVSLWIWRFVRIYFWLARFKIRSFAPLMLLILFLTASIFTVTEIAANILESPWARPMTDPLNLSPGFLVAVLHWTKVHIHELYKELSVLFVLGAIELKVILHHFREHKARNREKAAFTALGELFDPMNSANHDLKTNGDPNDRDPIKEQFWIKFSDIFINIYAEREVRDVDVSIMLYDSDEELIKMVFCSPRKSKFDDPTSFKPGQGAAGLAFSEKLAIYLPCIDYVHGIKLLQGRYEVKSNCYFATEKHPFQSVLSIPIFVEDPSPTPEKRPRPIGVLNLSCEKKSAFSPTDFVLAHLAAKVLGLIEQQKSDTLTV